MAAVDTLLRDREQLIKMLKFILEREQTRLKQVANRKRVKQNFKVGDWVYMKLQPYRQHSLKNHRTQKFHPKYFGPFHVLEKIWPVAYRLDLPASALIHPTIHVSHLKLVHGVNNTYVPLPTKFQDYNTPEAILERKLVKQHNKAATKILVKWAEGTQENAT